MGLHFSKSYYLRILFAAFLLHCLTTYSSMSQSANDRNLKTHTSESIRENLWFKNRSDAKQKVIISLIVGPIFTFVGIWVLRRAYRKGNIEFSLSDNRGRELIKWHFFKHQKPVRYWLVMCFWISLTLVSTILPIIVSVQAYKHWRYLP